MSSVLSKPWVPPLTPEKIEMVRRANGYSDDNRNLLLACGCNVPVHCHKCCLTGAGDNCSNPEKHLEQHAWVSYPHWRMYSKFCARHPKGVGSVITPEVMAGRAPRTPLNPPLIPANCKRTNCDWHGEENVKAREQKRKAALAQQGLAR